MKLLTTLLFIAMAFRLMALPSYVEFSTQGENKDRYADGTIVQDGEVYACVWVKTGANFAGITANGQLVDPVNNKLIGAAPLAKDGHCKPVVFMLNDDSILSGGSFEIHMLDTRKSAAQGGAMVSAGLSNGKDLDVVNAWKQVGAIAAANSAQAMEVAGENTPSVLPEDVPMPIIKSIQIFDGKVVLTVGNTVPYLRYAIESGATTRNMNKNYNVPGANGVGDGDLTLVIDNPDENRFFKVVRE